jgi:hypothetical protein
MSDDPRHRSRRRTQIQVEPLESRALLSASSVSSMDRYLLITPSSEYVNQQESAFTVTLTLVKVPRADREPFGPVDSTVSIADGALIVAPAPGRFPPDALDEPVTVDFTASDGPTTAASPIFAPFNESVTFPAGEAIETVTVPIISTVATPGPATISLSATTTLPSVYVGSYEEMVNLFSSPDATPPTITSVQPVTHGKFTSAVVLSFSKPMAPATVENIHNYRILSQPITADHYSSTFSWTDGPGTLDTETTQYQSFPIAAATYDPSARAVTLTLKRPTEASSLYEVSSAYPLIGHELTDSEGQPLDQLIPNQGGEFTISVQPTYGVTPSFVRRLKSSIEGTQNWLSG